MVFKILIALIGMFAVGGVIVSDSIIIRTLCFVIFYFSVVIEVMNLRLETLDR